MHGRMRESGFRFLADVDRGAGARRQFNVAGDKIGMQMRFKNMCDFQPWLSAASR